METFGPYFERALAKAGLSQREFARRAHCKQQALSEIIAGRRKPPLKHVARWAAVLEGHIDRKTFEEFAALAHSPPLIQQLVAKLRRQALADEEKA